MRETVAECMLSLAYSIRYPRADVLDASGSDDLQISHVRLSLAFIERRGSLRLRAIVEDWSMVRIVEEMY